MCVFSNDGASTLCVRQDGNSYSFLPKENFCARLILSCDIHSPGYSDDLLGVTVHTIVEKSFIRYLINVFTKYSTGVESVFHGVGLLSPKHRPQRRNTLAT